MKSSDMRTSTKYILIILSLFITFRANASPNEIIDNRPSFRTMVPEGFEGLLVNEVTPTELRYLDNTIADGELISYEGRDKYYRLGSDELVLEKTYSCSSIGSISKIVSDPALCDVMTFSLHQKLEEHTLLVYLQPDESVIPALNEKLGILSVSKDSKREILHIGNSTVTSLSGSIGYSANFTKNETANGSLLLTSRISFGEYLLEADPSVNGYNGEQTTGLSKLLGSRTFEGQRQEFGFKQSSESNIFNSVTGVIPNRAMIGGWYSSTNETLINKQLGYGLPLEIFMPFSGTIEVYRASRLLYVVPAKPGMVQIPTFDFPIGLYEVSIVRKPNSGDKLKPISRTVNNYLNDDGFSFALGVMDDGIKQNNTLKGEYKDLAAGFFYQSKLTNFSTESFSLVNIGNKRYWRTVIDHQSIYNVGSKFSTEFDLNFENWGVKLQTNYSGIFLDKRIGGHLSYQLDERFNVKRHTYFLNSSLMPNNKYSNSIVFTASSSKVENSKFDHTYNEFNLQNQNEIYVFGVPVNLSSSIGVSSKDSIFGNLSVNFNFGKNGDYMLNTNFSYAGRGESPYSEVILSKHLPEGEMLNSLSLTAAASKEFVSAGTHAEFTLDSANMYFGSQLYRDIISNKNRQSTYGHASGSVYFSGGQYAANSNNSLSGVIINLDESQGKNVDVYADVSGGGSVKLLSGNNFVATPTYSRSDIYINSHNAVVENYSNEYTLYKGNVSYLKITPRKTFEAAGFVDFKSINVNNITIKNHESSVDISSKDSDGYFQMTVSRQYPIIELIDGQGNSLCAIDIENMVGRRNSEDFVFLGGVKC